MLELEVVLNSCFSAKKGDQLATDMLVTRGTTSQRLGSISGST